MKDNNIWYFAEGHVNGTLTNAEKSVLDNKLATDLAFTTEFNESVNMLRSLNGNGQQQQFKANLRNIANNKAKKTRIISLPANYLKIAAIAACTALITSLSTYWIIQYNSKRIESQYVLLSKDLENYKRSQDQLIQNIQIQQTTTNTPVAAARYSGTGFAVTNDGYLVTNYHVIEGADSIYIQNSKGEYYKSSLISFNSDADLALLKVDSKKFRFGKGEVPYTLSSSKSDLGSEVYTLGLPDEDIVYYKGYISAKKGFEGDSLQYRLEIPSEHGLSGAPVMDASGSIIGIITGKKTESQTTTYAVNSKALLQMIKSLPGDINLKLSKTNNLKDIDREQQVKRLSTYTCAVKVYKQ